MDVFSKSKRSQVMSRICSHGNATTELALNPVTRNHFRALLPKEAQPLTIMVNEALRISLLQGLATHWRVMCWRTADSLGYQRAVMAVKPMGPLSQYRRP
jgi:hypothetical protein